MAVAGTSLTASGSSTDANSYTTASITPTANALILCAVAAGKSGTVTQPTLTGNGLTWTFMTRVDHDTSGTFASLFLFRAMGASPSSGTVAIAFGGVTHLACCWAIDQFTGTDTSGTHGSGAIVQSVGEAETDLGNTALVTIAAFSHVNNATYGALANQVNAGHTQGSSFTKLGDTSTGTPAVGLMTQWKATNDTTVDASWVTAGEKSGIIGVEIKAAGGASFTGATTLTEAVGIVTAGTAAKRGATTQTLTNARDTIGRLGAKSSSATALSVTTVTAASRSTFGAASASFAAGITTAGNRTLVSSSSTALVVSETTQGARSTTSSSTLTETLGITTAGEVGAAAIRGESSLTLTNAITTTGRLGAFAEVDVQLIAASGTGYGEGGYSESFFGNRGVTGTRTTFGVVSRSEVVSLTTSASRVTFGSTSLPLVLSVVTSGTSAGLKLGSASLTLVVSESTIGKKGTFGAVSLPVSVLITTSGVRVFYGATSLPLTFAATSAGTHVARGSSELLLTALILTNGRARNIITLDPILAGHIAHAEGVIDHAGAGVIPSARRGTGVIDRPMAGRIGR